MIVETNPAPPKSNWNKFAGGTAAPKDKYSYAKNTDSGEYHIWPAAYPNGKFAGYSVKFADTAGKNGGGLWHSINKDGTTSVIASPIYTLIDAMRAADKHYQSLQEK